MIELWLVAWLAAAQEWEPYRLNEAQRQWFKSTFGLEVKETHRDWAFCAHAILGTEPFIIPDAAADPRTCDNALVTGPP